MQTDFSGDPRPKSFDDVIEEVAEQRKGKPLRIRLQPMVLRSESGGRPQYLAWRDVRWTIECDTAAEAFLLRDAMRAFFAAMGRIGPQETIAVLNQAGKGEAVA